MLTRETLLLNLRVRLTAAHVSVWNLNFTLYCLTQPYAIILSLRRDAALGQRVGLLLHVTDLPKINAFLSRISTSLASAFWFCDFATCEIPLSCLSFPRLRQQVSFYWSSSCLAMLLSLVSLSLLLVCCCCLNYLCVRVQKLWVLLAALYFSISLWCARSPNSAFQQVSESHS